MKNDITPQIKSDLKQLRAEFDEITERWKNEDGFNVEAAMKEHIRKWGDSEAFKIDSEEDKKEKKESLLFQKSQKSNLIHYQLISGWYLKHQLPQRYCFRKRHL